MVEALGISGPKGFNRSRRPLIGGDSRQEFRRNGPSWRGQIGGQLWAILGQRLANRGRSSLAAVLAQKADRPGLAVRGDLCTSPTPHRWAPCVNNDEVKGPA